MHVRIGLHAGEPVVEGGDLFGTAVQMAARLCDAAEAGTILVSRELHDSAGVRGEASPLGPIALKGLPSPCRCSRSRGNDLRRAGASCPPLISAADVLWS